MQHAFESSLLLDLFLKEHLSELEVSLEFLLSLEVDSFFDRTKPQGSSQLWIVQLLIGQRNKSNVSARSENIQHVETENRIHRELSHVCGHTGLFPEWPVASKGNLPAMIQIQACKAKKIRLRMEREVYAIKMCKRFVKTKHWKSDFKR